MRIVSLAPSTTSIVCALGARRHLVGVTRWCSDVAEVRGLPMLGDCWKTNPRTLARLKPDLVLGSVPYRADTVKGILDTGATFLAQTPRSLEDIYEDIRLLGQVLRRRRQAVRVVDRMRRQLDELHRTARREKSRPRIYCEAWPRPAISSPPWVAEMVEIAGGRFVPRGKAGRKLAPRDILAARPEVIVIAWAGVGLKASSRKVRSRPGWSRLPAATQERIWVIRDEFLNTPGPILTDGAKILAHMLHPSVRLPRHLIPALRLLPQNVERT